MVDGLTPDAYAALANTAELPKPAADSNTSATARRSDMTNLFNYNGIKR
jgi:hypothetical protein